jgi:putative pyruvate formate lyase activating enzyme
MERVCRMKERSRRQFMESCLLLSCSGLGASFLCLVSGRKKEARATSKPGRKGSGTPEQGQIHKRARIDSNFEPAYLKLHRSGELKKRAEALWKDMESCCLCNRECGVNRLEGEEGFCRSSSQLEVSSYHPHYGEERPLVGKHGSGTIFFTNCGLRCAFCINWEINHQGKGSPRSIEDLADMMLRLQDRGCPNINLVTPTHYPAHILLAVDAAAARGLRLPLVYNTCGWERLGILKKLDGVIDIYLPDFKYWDGKMAAKYSSGAATYPEGTKAALLEMQRQVGVARPAPDGLMYRGLMIRHLVMPNGVSGSKQVMEWIGNHLPKDTYVNIMSQYRPVYKAFDYPEISRGITRSEYMEVLRAAKAAGLTRLDIQGTPL